MKRITQGVKSVNQKKQKTNSKTKSLKYKTKTPQTYYAVKSLFNPLPLIYECQMRYDGVVSRSMSAGVLQNYLFRCNSVYDPDATGTGTSCLYFTQLAALYDHYTVVSSTICVEPCATNTNTNTIICLYKDDDSTVSTTLQNALQRPGSTSASCNFNVSKCNKLYSKWSAAQTFGNTTPWTDDELQGTASTNPAEETYYVITAEDQAAATFTLQYNVKITYWVRWDELKTISV